MTISASSSLDYQVDELCTFAYQLAGISPAGQDVSADDLAMARGFLNLELMSLQAEGVVLRAVTRTTLTLTAADNDYSLPSAVIDVEVSPNGQAGTIVNSDGVDSIVHAMSRSEYMDISSKAAADSSGIPTRVYIEKTAPIGVVFWPTPSSSAVSWRYPKVGLLADADTGSVTLDLARRWLKAVTWAIAHHLALAKSKPLELAGYLRKEAERLKDICRADDSERMPIRMSLSHSGRNF